MNVPAKDNRRMNIRMKVILSVAISTILLLLTYTIFAKTFLMSGYVEVERGYADEKTAVVLESFDSLVNNIDIKASDWSAWDDAYQYVQNKNKHFEQMNLLPAATKLLNLSNISFFDKNRNLISERGYDPDHGVASTVPVKLHEIFSPESPLFNLKDGASNKGVVNTPDGLFIYTLRPVFNSKLDLPAQGFILMGRFVTPEIVKKIAELSEQRISLESMSDDFKKYSLDATKPISQIEFSEDVIFGFAVIKDYTGSPIGVFKSEIPRKITRIGTDSFNNTLGFFVLMIIVIAFFAIQILNYFIVSRLSLLDFQVHQVNQSIKNNLTVGGNDEVARLADSMNLMLSTLQSRNNELLSLNEIIKNQNQALVVSAKLSALGEMAGGVAHEINTPLTVIKLRSEMIEEELSHINSDRAENLKSSLHIIDKTVDRITKIVQSLKAFSRESNQLENVIYPVSSIINDALDLCHEKFKSHGVSLVTDIDDSLTVNCRPTEISQVLVNLLNNSYDAIQGLEVKKISIDARAVDNEYFEIAITDSGSGISAEIQDKIMQPFFTTKEVGKGTGIGLSISKGIVESHSGTIFLDKKSKNTRLVIRLPMAIESSVALSLASNS